MGWHSSLASGRSIFSTEKNETKKTHKRRSEDSSVESSPSVNGRNNHKRGGNLMSARIKKAISFLALLGLALGAIPASAQESTGSIVGIVKDANGAVVAGATVTIRNTDKNIVARTVNANDEGSYSAPFLLA